jgi:hypothetical protein
VFNKSANGHAAPADAHEWVSFEDPEEQRTWVFDVTFLLSRWTCIFGNGCQGVLTEDATDMVQGCCSYGAHFTDDEDIARVEAAAATLTKEDWQFRKKGRERGIVKTNKEGDQVSRLVDGACIFLNRPDFPGGPGCALHRAALRRGERPLDLKPDVCWQLPLRRDDVTRDDGHVVTTVAQWGRHNWGAGGLEFHWWCTEAPEAFVGQVPVYVEMSGELAAITGDEVYKQLAAYLDQRVAAAITPLPHPVVRARAR